MTTLFNAEAVLSSVQQYDKTNRYICHSIQQKKALVILSYGKVYNAQNAGFTRQW